MSAKHLRRLAVVLSLALVIWGAVAVASRSGRDARSVAFFPAIDTATIDTFTIVRSGDTLTLARNEKRWRANGFAADSTTVQQLLFGFVDSTISSELVAERASSHGRLGLTSDSTRKVRVVARGGQVLANFSAGHEIPGFVAMYMRRGDEPEVYAVRGGPAHALTRPLDDFRDRRIALVPPDSVGTIEVQRGKHSYVLSRGANGWTFASGAAADSAEVAAVLSVYRNLQAIGFTKSAQEDSLHFDTPKWRSRLLKSNGEVLVSLVADSIASGVWVRHDTGGAAYGLDSWTSKRVAPDDSTLRKKS